MLFLYLGRRRIAHQPFARNGWKVEHVDDILFYGVLGVILGGRLGYCFFYQPAFYLSNPLEIVKVWQGGMSFHGGMLGVAVAMVLYARKRNLRWQEVWDFVAPCVPTGLATGRIGNFLGQELWGRPADPNVVPWAMIFPKATQAGQEAIARHPSQLYQVLMEGLLLFILLWLYARKERQPGQVAAAFLFGYGVFRFIAEYFREPDAHLVWLLESTGLTMGQWLCVPMMLIGAAWWWMAGRAKLLR